MRPRKILVVYSADPDQAATWAWKLNLLPHYRALAVSTPEQLASQFPAGVEPVPEGVLLCVPQIDAAEPLLSLLPRCTLGIVVSCAAEVVTFPQGETGHFFRLAGTLPEEVFAHLCAATARKPGPRKGSPRLPRPELVPNTQPDTQPASAAQPVPVGGSV